MFFFHRPSSQALDRFRHLTERDSFSYREVGSTIDGSLPPGYNIDHNHICLGHGDEILQRACVALDSWEMFDLDWVELMHPAAPVTPGQTVLILAHIWKLYSLSASRVLTMIDTDDGQTKRWGFCYGTLQHHVEQGEERFTVEHRREDDSVWYDILAFSVPRHPLARLGYPLSRAAQRRFARDSKSSMLRAIS